MYIDIVWIDSILFSPNLQKTLYNQSINQLYTCMHFTHMHGEITNKVQPLRNKGFQI